MKQAKDSLVLFLLVFSRPKYSRSNSHIRTFHFNLLNKLTYQLHYLLTTYHYISWCHNIQLSIACSEMQRQMNLICILGKFCLILDKAELLTACSKSLDMPIESSHCSSGIPSALQTSLLQFVNVWRNHTVQYHRAYAQRMPEE